MPQTDRTQAPGPGPVLAERPRGIPYRTELAAALQACRRRPGFTVRRVIVGLLGLFLVMLGIGARYSTQYDGPLAQALAVVLPVAGLLLMADALLTLTLQMRLRRRLSRCPAATLYTDFVHFADPDDPLDLMVEDLRRVDLLGDWLVLTWGTGSGQVVLPLPDEACTGGSSFLFDTLREAAPGAVFHTRLAAPRMPHRLLPVLGLLLLLVVSLPLPAAQRTAARPEDDNSPWITAPAATPTPAPPTFSDTISLCVTGDGLFFTWDGGATVSQALTASECSYYEISSTADLVPFVLREDVAAFMTDFDGSVWVHTTTDQGRSWQVCSLDSLDFAPIYARCLGFTDSGLGYAAVSSDSTPATGDPMVGVYTSRDGGASWQSIAVPKSANDRMRQVNGLIFADDTGALASTMSAADNNWPHVFATADGGESWQELEMPFADSGAAYAVGLSGLTFADGVWQAAFTQAPAGSQEIVMQAPALTGPWEFSTVRDLY